MSKEIDKCVYLIQRIKIIESTDDTPAIKMEIKKKVEELPKYEESESESEETEEEEIVRVMIVPVIFKMLNYNKKVNELNRWCFQATWFLQKITGEFPAWDVSEIDAEEYKSFIEVHLIDLKIKPDAVRGIRYMDYKDYKGTRYLFYGIQTVRVKDEIPERLRMVGGDNRWCWQQYWALTPIDKEMTLGYVYRNVMETYGDQVYWTEDYVSRTGELYGMIGEKIFK